MPQPCFQRPETVELKVGAGAVMVHQPVQVSPSFWMFFGELTRSEAANIAVLMLVNLTAWGEMNS